MVFSYLVNLSHRYVDALNFLKNQFPSLKDLSCSQSFAIICIATMSNLVHSLFLLYEFIECVRESRKYGNHYLLTSLLTQSVTKLLDPCLTGEKNIM